MLVIWHDCTLEPETTSVMQLSSISCDVLGPLCSLEIVLIEVATQNPKEDVVVDPLGDGANATGAHDLSPCITQAAVNATA